MKANLANKIASSLELPVEAIESGLETPKNKEFGQLAFPVFRYSKDKKMPPPKLAEQWAKVISELSVEEIDSVSSVSGFVNFQIKSSVLQNSVSDHLLARPNDFAEGVIGKGQKVIVDLSSPNVAKPMSIGHLRATVIGQAVVNLCRAQGFEVTALNHLGDWGTQFGKLAWAYQNWAAEYDFDKEPFESLFALYVRFHKEAEDNPELEKAGAETFKKLEDGDEEIVKLWKWFVEVSLEKYDEQFALLNVKHDKVLGESFYNDKLAPTVELLKQKGLLVESDGAMVVEMDDEKMPPCLITKSDGASLYATRDIASAMYRHEHLNGDRMLYVVGVEQTLHFRQVFEVLKKMGFSWVEESQHISFGMYRFKNMEKMSSRKGNVIRFADVIEKAISMVKEIIEQKNPELEDKDKVAKQVGVGAIVFNDLVNDRVKNVDFDWDQVLDFEGNSGPFVQYSNVRCLSLLRKAGVSEQDSVGFKAELTSFEERELMRLLLSFDQVLFDAYQHYKPHVLSSYLLDLCRQFSSFYSKQRILDAPEDEKASRLALARAVNMVLEKGLGILNIEAPAQM
ncbi:MAG: arginine--tRNA ligase [Bdellovibrionales bacterium]|nr:arginine--tRNA ligase [Bdellovibrionales bacterium]